MEIKKRLESLIKRVEKLEKNSHPKRDVVTPIQLAAFQRDIVKMMELMNQSSKLQPMKSSKSPPGG